MQIFLCNIMNNRFTNKQLLLAGFMISKFSMSYFKELSQLSVQGIISLKERILQLLWLWRKMKYF